jgi:hypothetical protein
MAVLQTALTVRELVMQDHQPERPVHAANTVPAVHLHRGLWTWFSCGLATLLLFPSLWDSDPTFGWLPFWLVIAPLIDLAVLRRSWLAATSRAFLVRSRRRRRPVPRQARLLRQRRTARLRPLLAALISR